MEKKRLIWAFLLIFFVFAYGQFGCSSGAATGYSAISSDKFDLRGRYEGTRIAQGYNYEWKTILEIEGNELPLKGKLINQTPDGFVTYPFENGIIKDGKIFIKWSEEKYVEFKFYLQSGGIFLEGNALWPSYAIDRSGIYRWKGKLKKVQ